MAGDSLGDQIVGSSDLADLLRITPRRIQQLAREGILPRRGRGRYHLGDCLEAWGDYREALGARHAQVGADEEGASPDLKEEQARYYKHKADRERMQAERMAREVVPIGVAVDALRALVLEARLRLESAAPKIASRLPDKRRALPLVKAGLRDACDALADQEIERAVSRVASSD